MMSWYFIAMQAAGLEQEGANPRLAAQQDIYKVACDTSDGVHNLMQC